MLYLLCQPLGMATAQEIVLVLWRSSLGHCSTDGSSRRQTLHLKDKVTALTLHERRSHAGLRYCYEFYIRLLVLAVQVILWLLQPFLSCC